VSKRKGKKKPSFNVQTPSGAKRAALSTLPRAEKRPAAAATSWNDEHPSWRFGQLEVVGRFGWQTISREKLLDIRQQLGSFESMSWNEIAVKGKYFHHSIPVDDIIRPAQKRLEEMGIATDELFRFRLANLERVWGYRDRGVLQLLWWDPDHEICPSK
jgi:hypothetical protein